MLVLIGTGLLGVPVIPLLGRDAVDEYRWLALVLPLFVLALTPPVLNWAIALALRATRRPPMPAPLSFGGILRVAGWAIISWLCYGVHVYLLARQLGAEGGALLLLQCTGAFAAAFASGPLLLIVPAGAGVREAALLLLLGSTLTAPVAAVIAVISRLLFIVGDLAWSAVATLAARRRAVRPPAAPLPPDRLDLVGQGLPGHPEDSLDPVPVVVQHPDGAAGGVVADGHRLGPAGGVGPEALGRHLVELGGQVGQGGLEVAGRMVIDLAVHDPPLQLQPGRPGRVERVSLTARMAR